ncbi:splicing factor U2af large subunit A-like [Salvia miltiorrhiza]|uniref:splicing factor U2af large subunit A-like n=1 Tax=Salvia miltiorrhiza TaxID=226208 RepID=UPI0025ABA3D4|nr:splicing factor U2af large subunit A-like [Salvia miltiorrhiza]
MATTQQVTRHALRVYVGGLPPTANQQSLATFFSHVMSAIGGNTAGPGDAVVNVYINHEKKFAFVAMRSVEEASNAMALDGIIFEGAPVNVRRPSEYNPSLAATLGPTQPNTNLNLAAVGLTSGSALLPNTAAAVAGLLPGVAPTLPGMFPNILPLPGGQFGALPAMPMHAMIQQAARQALRVYVGGLPPTANEQSVATFFNHVMSAIGGNTAGPGDAVVNVYINHEKKFAFVEMRSVEEASNAMALDGIIFEGAAVKVRRPSDYNPSLAATLGPTQPNPNLNLASLCFLFSKL